MSLPKRATTSPRALGSSSPEAGKANVASLPEPLPQPRASQRPSQVATTPPGRPREKLSGRRESGCRPEKCKNPPETSERALWSSSAECMPCNTGASSCSAIITCCRRAASSTLNSGVTKLSSSAPGTPKSLSSISGKTPGPSSAAAAEPSGASSSSPPPKAAWKHRGPSRLEHARPEPVAATTAGRSARKAVSTKMARRRSRTKSWAASASMFKAPSHNGGHTAAQAKSAAKTDTWRATAMQPGACRAGTTIFASNRKSGVFHCAT
mmetsp:Transcript_32183/g.91691  ORF Transcript_32183/g.91691 Transcript_32183/m.91691 type:complete len:267 (-) Transcript_32183:3-803(-)